MALVRVTVQLRDSLPAEILLYVTSRSKLLDVLGGMGLEVEDDLEVRASVAGMELGTSDAHLVVKVTCMAN